MAIEKVTDPLSTKSALLGLVFRVYQGTGGAYPALEWVEEKPTPDDFEGFRRVYEPFLEFRLKEEFDELYFLVENGRTLGTVALVYNLKGKNIRWVPEEIRNEETGLIEFFMVDPEFWGKGYGSKLLDFAVEMLLSLGKAPYVITFPGLGAYRYYLRHGFRKVMDYEGFIVMRYTGKAEPLKAISGSGGHALRGNTWKPAGDGS